MGNKVFECASLTAVPLNEVIMEYFKDTTKKHFMKVQGRPGQRTDEHRDLVGGPSRGTSHTGLLYIIYKNKG